MGEIIKKTATDTGSQAEQPRSDSAAPQEGSIYKYVKDQVEDSVKSAKAEIKKEITEFKDSTNEKIKKAQEEQERNKIGTIEALAVFVALFTFVSINITVFSKIEYLSSAIWFMILMAISQILILSVFLIFLHKEHKKWQIWILPLLLIAILIVLLLLSMNNEKLNPQINKIETTNTQAETE